MQDNKNGGVGLSHDEIMHVVMDVSRWRKYSPTLIATVYYLYFERGWKPSKIAKHLEISLTTVHTILWGIKDVIRKRLQTKTVQTQQSTPQEQQQIQRRLDILDIIIGGKRG